jgi:hypothetical protein
MKGFDSHFEAFAALQAIRSVSGAAPARSKELTASHIVSYAQREDSVADMLIERALRNSQATRTLYLGAIRKRARAFSLSVAAAADRVTERHLGEWRIEIVEEASGSHWLVIHAPRGSSMNAMIELRRPDGSGRRLELGQPVDRVFQLVLDPAFEEVAGIVEWLQDPLTEIYLL